jgi:hypothetical protein
MPDGHHAGLLKLARLPIPFRIRYVTARYRIGKPMGTGLEPYDYAKRKRIALAEAKPRLP